MSSIAEEGDHATHGSDAAASSLPQCSTYHLRAQRTVRAPYMEGIEVYRLLAALMLASALAFGFGYVSSPTHAQGTDQTEAGSDQAPTDDSAQPDNSGSDEMGTDEDTEMPPDEDMPSDETGTEDQSDDGSNQ